MRRPGLLAQFWAVATLALLVRVTADGVLAAGLAPASCVLPHRLDANIATIAEWTALPGCGRARAEAIVVARIRSGPFRGAADLERVDGVGAGFVAAVAAWLDFSPPASGRR